MSVSSSNNQKEIGNRKIAPDEPNGTEPSGSVIFQALPFKIQVRYFTDYVRVLVNKKLKAYPPMIKTKLDKQCFQRRWDEYYWDEKNKVLL